MRAGSWEGEYIDRRGIQRSLETDLFQKSQRAILGYALWIRGQRRVGEDGRSRNRKVSEKRGRQDETRFVPLLPIYRSAESPKMQGGPRGFTLRRGIFTGAGR